MGKVKLFVVQGSRYQGHDYGGDGTYHLVLPKLYKEQNTTMWSHMCSSSSFAMGDLQYPKRKAFLDNFFGVNGWEFVKDLEGNILDDLDYSEDAAVDCDKLTAAMDKHFGGDNHAKIEVIVEAADED